MNQINKKKQKTSEKILDIISKKGRISANELSEILEISPRAIFKQLANLMANNQLDKIGKQRFVDRPNHPS